MLSLVSFSQAATPKAAAVIMTEDAYYRGLQMNRRMQVASAGGSLESIAVPSDSIPEERNSPYNQLTVDALKKKLQENNGYALRELGNLPAGRVGRDQLYRSLLDLPNETPPRPAIGVVQTTVISKVANKWRVRVTAEAVERDSKLFLAAYEAIDNDLDLPPTCIETKVVDGSREEKIKTDCATLKGATERTAARLAKVLRTQLDAATPVLFEKKSMKTQTSDSSGLTMCTADVLTCPGGEKVGRDPAKDCDFRVCPEADGMRCTQSFPSMGNSRERMDVRMCADGTYVTRQPPDCRFNACPADETYDRPDRTRGNGKRLRPGPTGPIPPSDGMTPVTQ